MRLVRATQLGARVVRLTGMASLWHPAAPALLRELTMLGFERVEVCADLSPLAAASDADLYHLRSIDQVWAPLWGANAIRHDQHLCAGAFERQLQVMKRLERVAGLKVVPYAVIHDAESLVAFAAAWDAGHLPGAPRFALASSGGDLTTLAAVATSLSAPSRAALERVLPSCLVAHQAPPEPSRAVGTLFTTSLQPDAPPPCCDVHAIFRPCSCAHQHSSHCPGIAYGWTRASKVTAPA